MIDRPSEFRISLIFVIIWVHPPLLNESYSFCASKPPFPYSQPFPYPTRSHYAETGRRVIGLYALHHEEMQAAHVKTSFFHNLPNLLFFFRITPLTLAFDLLYIGLPPITCNSISPRLCLSMINHSTYIYIYYNFESAFANNNKTIIEIIIEIISEII